MLKVLIGDEAFGAAWTSIRALRRHGGDRRGFPPELRRRDRARPWTLRPLVRAGRDANRRRERALRRGVGTYRLDLTQDIPPTPGQTDKKPAVIPVALGLVAPGRQGPVGRSDRVSSNGVFVLDRPADSVLFHDVPQGTVPSVFAASPRPVKVKLQLSDGELLTLLRDDSDPFNRWQAAQTVAMRFLVRRSASPEAGLEPAEDLVAALDAFSTAKHCGTPPSPP
jgi:aminopeptidase N